MSDLPINVKRMKISDLRQDESNLNTGTQRGRSLLEKSIQRNGLGRSVLIDKNGVLIAGNKTTEEVGAQGFEDVIVVQTTGRQLVAVQRMDLDMDTDARARELALADNRVAEVDLAWDTEQLKAFIDAGVDVKEYFFDEELAKFAEFAESLEQAESAPVSSVRPLSADFGISPFTVLDSRLKWWLDRKRQWLAMGIQSEIGRSAASFPEQESLNGRGAGKNETGVSIFDPVLCELIYRWYSPVGACVLDPFAGGSVRGIVASKLGRAYTGVDLSQAQCKANRAQAHKICLDTHEPEWVTGDSNYIKGLVVDQKFDLLFSCPPYFDLEVYSQHPADLSSMEWGEFLDSYARIIRYSCEMLAENRFAGWVVGEVRDAEGKQRNLVGKTIEAFETAGLRLYNKAVLVTPHGSVPFRTRRQFEHSRKLGGLHQEVLIFVKGDPVLATDYCGQCEWGSFENSGETA